MSENKKIASEAKLVGCNIKTKCDDLKFDCLEFSPPQTETITRYIEDEDELSITIEAKDKKLKIPSINCSAIIKNCNIKSKGFDMRFDSLKIPENRITTILRFIREETIIRLTLSLKQEKLPGVE